MKVLLALAVLTTSAISLAADNREIQDIMYLPSAGKSYGFTTGEYIKGKVKADSGDSDISGYGLTQTLGHSFTDRLSLQADINYLNSTIDPDVGRKTDLTGISDPTISAKFRTMDEGFRWDVIGGATIGVGDNEVKSNGDRNNLQGGSSVFAGTQFGGKSESFQWALLGLATRNLKATTDTSGVGKVKSDEYNELLLRADILSRLAERSFLRTFVSGNFGEDYGNNRTSQNTPSTTTYTAGAEYQHKMSEDLMLRGGVDYAMINSRTGQVDDFNLWNFRVGANYQF